MCFQITLSLEVSGFRNYSYVSNLLVSGPSAQSCFYIPVDWTLPYLNQIVAARLLSDLFYNSIIKLACFFRFLCCAVEALSGSTCTDSLILCFGVSSIPWPLLLPLASTAFATLCSGADLRGRQLRLVMLCLFNQHLTICVSLLQQHVLINQVLNYR
jgi:hypothetical protein